ncbi:MAG: hypothetical protein JSW63_05035 [Ignavibacterium sp.]|nr:MAG: hypothetical protein JSW63_05035 [Ignavibacterium sp.]
MKKYLLLLSLFYSVFSYGQETTQEYESEKMKLTDDKIRLNMKIEALKLQIDSLNSYIPELEKELDNAQRELYILKYGEEIGNKIAYKQIWKGMTDEMVMESWGEPDRVDQNVESWGTFTQWYYGDVTFFFKDGKLTDWEGEEEKPVD